MSFGGGGFFGSGAQQSDATGANTINPNLGTEASQTSAPIISFQSNISTSGKNASVSGGGSPNVTVNSTTTDFGALAAGANIATQGINLAGATLNLQAAQLDNIADITKNSNASVAGIAKTGLDNALASYQSSLDWGNAVQGKAYSFASGSLTDVLDTFKSSLSGIENYTQNLVGDVIKANQTSTAQTITGLTDLSARTTTSSDQRIADTAKYAIYGAIAIAIAFALRGMK